MKLCGGALFCEDRLLDHTSYRGRLESEEGDPQVDLLDLRLFPPYRRLILTP